MMDLTVAVGASALVGAVASVVGAVFLGLFFSKGQPWGTLNDLASIVLMAAMLPVAIGIATLQSGSFPASAVVVLVGCTGMVGAGLAQAVLVAGWRTYEQLLPWTLGFGAVVGLWYIGVGALGLPIPDGGPLAAIAIASGLGFLAVGYGFWRGAQQHPASIVGGVLLIVGSTSFLVWLGLKLVTGEVVLVWPA